MSNTNTANTANNNAANNTATNNHPLHLRLMAGAWGTGEGIRASARIDAKTSLASWEVHREVDRPWRDTLVSREAMGLLGSWAFLARQGVDPLNQDLLNLIQEVLVRDLKVLTKCVVENFVSDLCAEAHKSLTELGEATKAPPRCQVELDAIKHAAVRAACLVDAALLIPAALERLGETEVAAGFHEEADALLARATQQGEEFLPMAPWFAGQSLSHADSLSAWDFTASQIFWDAVVLKAFASRDWAWVVQVGRKDGQ